VPIGGSALILVDEASMVSMEDLADIVRYAEAQSGKVVLAGDHGQLTAVESGGGMNLLTRQLESAQLAEPVRFAAEWEGEASHPGTWVMSSGWSVSAPTVWAGTPPSPPLRLRLPAAAATRTPRPCMTCTRDRPRSAKSGTGNRRPSSPRR
jgi:hypothetical protein